MTSIKLGHRRAGAILMLIAFSVISYAQSPPATTNPEIVTDRPDVTESSIVVPKGSLQIENGATWTSDHGSQSLDFSESLIRFGASSQTEIRIVAPNYFGSISGPDSPSGFGDIALGMKQHLGPLPGGFDLSVIAAISLPTGASRVSSHGFDPFIKFPWSKELSAGWSLGGMQSLFWNTDSGKRNGVWEPTFYIEKEITKPWDAFAEYAGDFAQWGPSKQIAHFGTAYRVTPSQQVDFHFGFGLSHDAPSSFFAVGYSFRIDKLWSR
jgi:Putative MetA-pathway of phenol degradation